MNNHTTRKTLAVPDMLPARFTINPDAFEGMTVAVLKMPYSGPIGEFQQWLGRYSELPEYDENNKRIYPAPPYRLLNDVLTACAPTIVHGFEKYGIGKNKGRRMLAVGKPLTTETEIIKSSTLVYPSSEQISVVMRRWIEIWGERRWLKQIITNAGKGEWEKLLNAMSATPDTNWDISISACKLAEEPDFLSGAPAHLGNLAYEAIPSLVATLLHETKTLVGPNKTEIRWRRMQDSNKGRYCVISQPLSVDFFKENPHTFAQVEKSGYFSYKVEIDLQTQSGRKEPWLYLSLHCMRYAHRPFSFNKRGNDVTVLVAANRARLSDWKTDTTLIRLKATPNANTANREIVSWLEDLPLLLAEIEARPLAKPGDLYESPLNYWRRDEVKLDEYYVLHTEGYRYKGERSGSSNQPVLTGFSLMERAEVLGRMCEENLSQTLRADTSMPVDAHSVANTEKPLLLSNIYDLMPKFPLPDKKKKEHEHLDNEGRIFLRDEQERLHRQIHQPVIVEAVHRATNGRKLVVACFHRLTDTLNVVTEAIRDSFLLNSDDILPEKMILLPPATTFVPEVKMVQPLLNQDGNAPRQKEVVQWRDAILQKWQELLRQTFSKFLDDDQVICAAIVELDKATHKDKVTPDRYSIHSVIREACDRENVLSQMIITPDRLKGQPRLDSATKGKALQVAQEIVTRQIGALYEKPANLYRYVGIEKVDPSLPETLDVVSLSFRSTKTGFRFCLATRLRSDGMVDVLLPQPEADWMPYVDAGPFLGRFLAPARKDVCKGRINDAKTQSTKQSRARLLSYQISDFVENILTQRLERPTVVVLEAEKWRSVRDDGGNWWQLQNPVLASNKDRLIFGARYPAESQRHYGNSGAEEMISVPNLVAVIRLRSDEVPQYITNRQDWRFDDAELMRDYFELAGFIDQTTTEVFHYYSIGKLPQGAGEPQKKRTKHDPYKLVSGINSGGGIAYRHPSMLEIVPFCVREDFVHAAGLKALCRIPHYLRSSPAWAMGSLDSPYPLHLGDVLIEDQICILGLGDD